MVKNCFLLVIASILISLVAGATPPSKNIRVFALDAATLQAHKKQVRNKDAAVMPAYLQLVSEANDALKEGPFSVVHKSKIPPSGSKHDYMSLAPYFWPDPAKSNGLPYMRKDGETNPEVKEYLDKDYMPRMVKLVQTLSTAYYFSDDERYAAHAAKLLRVWFLDTITRMSPNLNYAQAIKGVNEGRGAGLIDTRHFYKLIDAIGLLQTSKHWKQQDQKGMKDWFRQYLNWMQTSKNGMSEMNAKNNHGTWYDVQRLSFALFIDSTTLAKNIVANATHRLNSQMDDEGKFPLEMERTLALHYSCFDMEAFFLIATMAEKTGFNFWNYTSEKGASLQKGFNFLHPYITNQKTWTGKQIKPFNFEDDAFPLLVMAAKKYNCTDCKAAVEKLAGDKMTKLRLNLLY